MDSCLRCPDCCVSWPDMPRLFRTCPECGAVTDRISKARPIDVDDAMSRLKHARFDRFYRTEWPALREKRDAA